MQLPKVNKSSPRRYVRLLDLITIKLLIQEQLFLTFYFPHTENSLFKTLKSISIQLLCQMNKHMYLNRLWLSEENKRTESNLEYEFNAGDLALSFGLPFEENWRMLVLKMENFKYLKKKVQIFHLFLISILYRQFI